MTLASKQKSVSNKGEKYQKTRTWKWKRDRWGETGELWMNGCRGWMHAVRPKICLRSRAEGGEVRPQNGLPWPCREPWAQYVSFLFPSHTARSPSTLQQHRLRGGVFHWRWAHTHKSQWGQGSSQNTKGPRVVTLWKMSTLHYKHWTWQQWRKIWNTRSISQQLGCGIRFRLTLISQILPWFPLQKKKENSHRSVVNI